MYTYIFLQVVGNDFGTQIFFLSWHVRQWNKRHPHGMILLWLLDPCDFLHVIHGPWILMDFGVGVLDSGSWILVLRCTLPGIFMAFFVVLFVLFCPACLSEGWCKKRSSQPLQQQRWFYLQYFFLGISRWIEWQWPPLKSGWPTEK